MKIYIVIGVSGQYEEKEEWIVASYTDKESAYLHRDFAKKEAKKAIAWLVKEDLFSNIGETDENAQNIYDPIMFLHTSGIEYYVCENELKDVFKEVER